MEPNNIPGEVTALGTAFIAWLPRIVTVIAILLIGYIVALLLKSVTVSALKRIGLDRRLDHSPAHNVVRRLTNSPSTIVGKVVYWLALIITFTIAIFALGLPVLSALVQGVYSYVPNILGAIVILGLALAATTAVSGLINRLMGETPTGKLVATAVPVLVLSIAVFAILEQLRIAPTIVTITYIALLGSLSLGFAIAFGLGGREVASKLLEHAYDAGKNNMGQVKRDIKKGKERGEREARDKKRKYEEEM